MSAFSEYAAASEWNTAVHQHTDVQSLNHAAAQLDHEGFPRFSAPVSADMLTVLTRGTYTQRRDRRKRARGAV